MPLLQHSLQTITPFSVLYLGQGVFPARTLGACINSHNAQMAKTVTLKKLRRDCTKHLIYWLYPGGQLFPLLPGK